MELLPGDLPNNCQLCKQVQETCTAIFGSPCQRRRSSAELWIQCIYKPLSLSPTSSCRKLNLGPSAIPTSSDGVLLYKLANLANSACTSCVKRSRALCCCRRYATGHSRKRPTFLNQRTRHARRLSAHWGIPNLTCKDENHYTEKVPHP